MGVRAEQAVVMAIGLDPGRCDSWCNSERAVVELGGRLVEVAGDDPVLVVRFSSPRAAVTAGVRLAGEGGTSVAVLPVTTSDTATAVRPRLSALLDAAPAGHVVVTGAVAAALEAGSDEVSVVDVGAHRLRDLGPAERLFLVSELSRAASAPPLRTLDAVPNNLPVQLTSFVGRQRELAELDALLRRPRLVTLTGSGGCGKTRLSLHAAAAVADAFADGVWFCDLSRVTDPIAVPGTVAAVLGADEDPPAEAAVRNLGSRQALVILDNCEHVVAAAAALAEAIVRSCPEVTVVATSREPLGVPGEVVWRVPSLDLPGDGDAAGTQLTTYDAVRLFIERASSARPNFRVSEDNAPAIAAICARLDGIPLAIELAAARVRLLSVDQIAEGLDDRFRLLGSGARTVMPRQQTLLASVAWSHDLLDDRQRRLLRRLSAFAGSFDLDAAEAVGAGDGLDQAEVLDVLGQLVDRSLVVVDDTVTPARYRLLETIRQYAADRAVETGDATGARLRHLEHYTERIGRLVDRVVHGRVGDTPSLAPIDIDYDNAAAALDWALASGHTCEGLQLGTVLWRYWRSRPSRIEQGRRWLEDLDAAAESNPVPADVRASALIGLVWLHVELLLRTGQFEVDVPALVTRIVDAARETGRKDLLASALDFVAGSAVASGRPDRKLLDEALAAARDTGDPWLLAEILSLPAAWWVGWLAEDVDEAAHFAEELLELGRRSGTPAAEGVARINLGPTRIVQGCLQEARDLFGRDGFSFGVGPHRLALDVQDAVIGVYLGEPDAPATGRAALTAAEEARASVFPPFAAALFQVAGPDSDTERLAVMTTTAEGSHNARGAAALTAAAVALRPRLAMEAGRLDDARQLIEGVIPLLPQVEIVDFNFLRLDAALLARLDGDLAKADSVARDALQVAVRRRASLLVPDALDLLATLDAEQGDDLVAVRLFASAAAQRERMGTVAWLDDPAGTLEVVRARLGDAEFEAAWTTGALLTAQDAATFVNRGRGPRKRPATGWTSLTPAELSVVRLVALGLPNQEIAQRLFISRRTVTTHLTRVFAKLGVSTRAELSAMAVREGL